MKEDNDKTNLVYQDVKTSSGSSYSEDKLAAIRLPSLAGKRFLDLGCNAGFYCGKAFEQGATRVLGVDLDPKIIRVASERHPNCEFRDGGWDRFPEGEFDVIICLSAIHYAADFLGLAANIRAALAPGGLFVLEGGLLDPEGSLFTDLPIPVWRKVGDRCRHLSHGFVKRHLLRSFDWEIVGGSVARGGDPIDRFLIHARPGAEGVPEDSFQVDMTEFARCLALSADFISPTMPSYHYVRQLGACGEITPGKLAAILGEADAFNAFVNDLAFAIGSQRPATLRVRGASGGILAKVCEELGKRGITIKSASGTLEPLAACVKRLDTIPNNLKEGKLAGKAVVDLNSSDHLLSKVLFEMGARICYLRDSCLSANDPHEERIRPVSDLLKPGTEGADVAFFDARTCPGFDSVHGVLNLVDEAGKLLKPDGILFCVLQAGTINPEIDVVNSVVLTGEGPMPSSPYFFESLMRGFAVRVLETTINYETGVITRLVRIKRKKPSLLLIFAASESGKTTLARDLKTHDHHCHLSNDYVFFEFARLRKKGMLDWIPEELAALPEKTEVPFSCGHFNRRLESEPALLNQYLELVASLIPSDRQLVSIDLDLRDRNNYPTVRDFFVSKGYSVWLVTR